MQITERSKNKQLAINMVASLLTFVVGMGIRFFLTPYIVRTLGPEAYGFIGLSANILSYTSLITIALNSMAGRFVTIKYQEGNVEEANKYYASVFYSNLVLAGVILLFGMGCVIWLEYMINIPDNLVFDVKLLFSLLVVNNIVGLVTGIWGTATFIKNRLDLSNIRGIIGNLMNATILVVAFTFFAPHIWYMGIAGMVLTLYSAITNKQFTRILTPELRVKIKYFDLSKVLELLKSGIWNVFNKLGEILGTGLDLVLVNLFISATAMGYFSITKNVPFLVLSLFQMIAGVFAPVFTQLYAKKQIEELTNELNRSIRILGFFATIPVVCLFVYGKEFYQLWLPTEDSNQLQMLTILGSFGMVFSMPLEALWNIFTITNKLKYSTYYSFFQHLCSFLIVVLSMFSVEDVFLRLCILAGTRTTIGLIKSILFLPLYGAKCLDIKRKSFYPSLIKSFVCFLLALLLALLIHNYLIADTWMRFIVACILCMLANVFINVFVILSPQDRKFIYNRILRINR